MSDKISIVKTRDNELEFDINITGAQKKEPVVRLIIEDGKVHYTFDCSNLKDDKWVCAIPPLPQLKKTAYPFRLEVIIDGYFFEPYRKTMNVIPEPVVKSSKVAEKHPETPVVKKEVEKPAAKKPVPEAKKKPVIAKEEVQTQEPVVAPPVQKPVDDFANMATAWLNRTKPVVTEQDKKVKNVIKDALESKPKPVVAEDKPIVVPAKPEISAEEEARRLKDIKIKAILDSAKST